MREPTREERAYWIKLGKEDPVRAYTQHRARARLRGVPFQLTLAEWWWLWEPHYERRGRGLDGMMMCRLRDEGPYALGNVRIATGRHNEADQKETDARRRAALGNTITCATQ